DRAAARRLARRVGLHRHLRLTLEETCALLGDGLQLGGGTLVRDSRAGRQRDRSGDGQPEREPPSQGIEHEWVLLLVLARRGAKRGSRGFTPLSAEPSIEICASWSDLQRRATPAALSAAGSLSSDRAR